MSRNIICILLLITIFMLAHGSEFQSIPLNQNFRSLAAVDSSSPAEIDDFVRVKDNFAISVNLGEEYLARNNMTSANKTEMVVLLYTNVTSFCRTCLTFARYNCTNNTCQANNTISQRMISPYYRYKNAHPINQSLTIGNSTKSLWKLATNANLFSFDGEDHGLVFKTSVVYQNYDSYVNGKGAYGFIGLGVGGDAFSNFRGDHPLFSIFLNSTGQGQLIFGKNTSLYNTSSTPIVLTTDTNWTMLTQKITWGDHSNTSYVSKLIFDLQYPGIGIPSIYWNDPWTKGKDFKTVMEKKYKVQINETCAIDGYWLIYKGNLTDLPDITIGLANGQNLTIPPAAYTRKSSLANDTWVLLLNDVPPTNGEKYLTDQDRYINHTVIGWPVMSYFYTVFEQKKGSEPTVTLYKAQVNPTSASANTPLIQRLIQIAAFIVLIAVIGVCFRKRTASKLKTELGEELKYTHFSNENKAVY